MNIYYNSREGESQKIRKIAYLIKKKVPGKISKRRCQAKKCKTYNQTDNPDLSEYPTSAANIRLRIDGNIKYTPAAPGNGKYMGLINIPELWIQGCSFKNLEKCSEWTKKGSDIFRQYGALV